jgi:hypothetical protein
MLAVKIRQPRIGSSIKRALKHIIICMRCLRKKKPLSEEQMDLFWPLHCDLANRRYHDMAETLCHVYYDMSNDNDSEIFWKLYNLRVELEKLNKRRKAKIEASKRGITKA